MSLTRTCITSSKIPKAPLPLSQAVVVDRTVYVSGCLGFDPTTNKLVEGGVAAEAKQALANLKTVLEAAGSGVDRVAKVTVFLNHMTDFAAVNEEYGKVFVENCPARSCFAVGKLPGNGQVEIEAIAVTGDVQSVSVTV